MTSASGYETCATETTWGEREDKRSGDKRQRRQATTETPGVSGERKPCYDKRNGDNVGLAVEKALL